MISQSALEHAFIKAFPDAVGFPPKAAELRQLVAEARETNSTAALVVLDRLISGSPSSELDVILGTSPTFASEAGRQRAAALAGRGSGSAHFRQFGASLHLDSVQQKLPSSVVRQAVIAQLRHSAEAERDYPAWAPMPYRLSSVFIGSPESTKAAAGEFATSLAALGIVDRKNLEEVPPHDLHGLTDRNQHGLGQRQQELGTLMRTAFNKIRFGERAVLFFDASAAMAHYRADPARDAMLWTIATELVSQLSAPGDLRLVVGGSQDDLRSLCLHDPGLHRRLRTVVTL